MKGRPVLTFILHPHRPGFILSEVLSVAGGVLADEDDLAGAVGGQRPGFAAATSSPKRCVMQPAAITARSLPSFLRSAAARRVSTDSCAASWRKPQVLTTTTSAASTSAVSS